MSHCGQEDWRTGRHVGRENGETEKKEGKTTVRREDDGIEEEVGEVKVEERRMTREREQAGGGKEGMKKAVMLGASDGAADVVKEEEQEEQENTGDRWPLPHALLDGTRIVEDDWDNIDDGIDYEEYRPEAHPGAEDVPPKDDKPPARTEKSPGAERTPSLGKPCGPKCVRKCTSKISEERRREIFQQYLDLTSRERRAWVYGMVAKQQKNRNTIGATSRRSMTYQYHLTDDRSVVQQVCKTFFLSTLGYNPKNDSLITTVVGKTPLDHLTPAEDQRGRHAPANKINMEPIFSHIESYGPCGHSNPGRGPLPGDVNIKIMYSDFKQKHQDVKCSYDTYRKAVKAKTSTFTKQCLSYDQD